MAQLQMLPRLGRPSTASRWRTLSEPEVQTESLAHPPPPINPEEEDLDRKTRRTLSQLRSGFCSSLEDYRQRVGLSTSNICPCCRQEEHTVQHVFECSEYPTDLSPLDLWTRPSTAAEFLRTLPFFDLPEEERPPPRTSTFSSFQQQLRGTLANKERKNHSVLG